MRATQLRWPLRLLSRGHAVDLVNLELKAALVNGGYAVVTVDVRGTGGRHLLRPQHFYSLSVLMRLTNMP